MIDRIVYGILAIAMMIGVVIIVIGTVALISVSPWLALWPLVVVGFLAFAWAVGSLIERWWL